MASQKNQTDLLEAVVVNEIRSMAVDESTECQAILEATESKTTTTKGHKTKVDKNATC